MKTTSAIPTGKLFLPGHGSIGLDKMVQSHKPDIVPRPVIFFAGIAQAYKQNRWILHCIVASINPEISRSRQQRPGTPPLITPIPAGRDNEGMKAGGLNNRPDRAFI
jgi:hypothetical protein